MTALLQPLSPADLPELLPLLVEALPAHSITEQAFARKVLLDPRFNPDLALVARSQSRVSGFAMAVAGDGGQDENRAWITLFAVREDSRRRGIGAAMFDQVESRLAERGAAQILVSPYAPNYWTPGVDEAAYPAALTFLERRGYTVISRPIAMRVDLKPGWQAPAWAIERERHLEGACGLRIEPVCVQNLTPLLRFLNAEFPGDWERQVREACSSILLGYRRPADVLVAAAGEEVRGFAHIEGSRFGPFGVGAAHRGQGVGAVLLYRSLADMARRPDRAAWFMWTGQDAADRVYRPAGFRETNRYSILMKRLSS